MPPSALHSAAPPSERRAISAGAASESADTSATSTLPPLSPQERARLTDILSGFGLPPERHEEYLALVAGFITAAFDAYFDELKAKA